VSDISAAQIPLPKVSSGEVPQFKRVIALANGSAEIVAALGYTSILVGRDIASTLPELSEISIDNPSHSVSIETVLAQNPDLILIDSNTSPASALTSIKKTGVRIVEISSPYTVNGIATKERKVAQAIGTPRAGGLLAQQISRLSFAPSKKKIAFLYLRGNSSIYLIGGPGSGGDSLIRTLGYKDVGAEKLPNAFNAMTSEELIALQPDIFLLMSKGLESVGGIEGLVKLPGIAQTPAGKKRAVVTVDDSLLLSFGPRTIPMLNALELALKKVSP
jgi:iron complex transport system substrate-binding protein